MKKSTKFGLVLALLSIVAGGIGIGISVKQFSTQRLHEEITLKKDITSLTIEVDKASYFHNLLISKNTDSDMLMVNEKALIPHHVQANFETEKQSGHLTLTNKQTQAQPFAIGVQFDEGTPVTINVPNQIKEIKFIAKGNSKETSTNFHNLTLDQLELAINKSQVHLSDVKTDTLTVEQTHGYLSLTDSAIYDKFNVTTDTAGINLNRNSLIQTAALHSKSGDIQILDSKMLQTTSTTEHGLTSLEEVTGQFEASSKDGDIYLVDRSGKSHTKLNAQNGNVFALIDKAQAEEIPLTLKGEIGHTFDAATILVDKEKANAHHQFTTKNGQIYLAALVQTEYSDAVDDETDYIEDADKLPSTIIPLDSGLEFFEDEAIIPFIN